MEAAAAQQQQQLQQEAQAHILAAADQAAKQGQKRADQLAWQTARLQLGPARAAKLAVSHTDSQDTMWACAAKQYTAATQSTLAGCMHDAPPRPSSRALMALRNQAMLACEC